VGVLAPLFIQENTIFTNQLAVLDCSGGPGSLFSFFLLIFWLGLVAFTYLTLTFEICGFLFCPQTATEDKLFFFETETFLQINAVNV